MSTTEKTVGVKAVEDYTFDELVEHLHDYHGFNAEEMADDEVMNGTEVSIIESIRNMTRAQALERLPYHYFMDTSVPRDSAAALESARITHDDDHSNNPGGGGKVHFHPGRWSA